MANDQDPASAAKAKELHEIIKSLNKARQENSAASKPGSESPREFIHRRMHELEEEEKRSKK